MQINHVSSNIASKVPRFAGTVQAGPQRTSPVLSQRELRDIVLQMVG